MRQVKATSMQMSDDSSLVNFWNKRAFTLFELLVVLVIVGILMLAGLPSWRSFVQQNKESAIMNRLVAAVRYTRNVAINSGEVVKFCKSVDGKQCGGDWNSGQIAILKSHKVLRVFSALPPQMKLSWRGGFGRDSYLEFTPMGRLVSGAGRFYLQRNASKTKGYKLIVNQTGRIRVEQVA